MLTAKQQRVLDFIQQYYQQHGVTPTLREVADGLQFKSVNSVRQYVQTLADKEVIEWETNTSRGIRLPAEAHFDELPVVGKVAAGMPLLAVENVEAYHRVDATLFKYRADYLLRVSGDSMQDGGILDGDLLAVHKTPTANPGEIVVARLDGEVTVKKLERTPTQLRLLPQNDAYEPIEVDPNIQDFAIEGLAVGVLRVAV